VIPSRKLHVLIILPALVVIPIFVACVTAATPERSADSRAEIHAAPGWRRADPPREGVSLFLLNSESTGSLAVSSFPKDEDVSIEEYAEGLRALMSEQIEGLRELKPPRDVSGENLRGFATILAMPLGGGDLMLLHLALEGPHYFHQLQLTIVPSEYERQEEAIQAMIESFREL
jgi:hypothetical protein